MPMVAVSTVVGPLIEIPVMLTIVWMSLRGRNRIRIVGGELMSTQSVGKGGICCHVSKCLVASSLFSGKEICKQGAILKEECVNDFHFMGLESFVSFVHNAKNCFDLLFSDDTKLRNHYSAHSKSQIPILCGAYCL